MLVDTSKKGAIMPETEYTFDPETINGDYLLNAIKGARTAIKHLTQDDQGALDRSVRAFLNENAIKLPMIDNPELDSIATFSPFATTLFEMFLICAGLDEECVEHMLEEQWATKLEELGISSEEYYAYESSL